MPIHVHALNAERAGAEAPPRRRFLKFVTTGSLAISATLMGAFNFIFLKPRVTYGPPSRLRVGRPETYTPGLQVTLPESQVVVRREGDRFAAISLVCTHLGCTVAATDVGFDCPCHGSRYDQRGEPTDGPAPKALDWYRVRMTPGGELEVDKNESVPADTWLEVKS